MQKLFIIANWKANDLDALSWFQEVSTTKFPTQKEVIVCPPFTLLEKVSWLIGSKNLEIKAGSQDISKFDEGSFTGEVNGKMLKNTVDYVIIGHSERRDKFAETDEDVASKVLLAKKYDLTPIVCVQNEFIPIPEDVGIVAYEPVFAIGSGHPDTPQNADEVARKIKEKNTNIRDVLYGGSINPENVKSFTEKENISGVLVGSKSLDPVQFARIITNA